MQTMHSTIEILLSASDQVMTSFTMSDPNTLPLDFLPNFLKKTVQPYNGHASAAASRTCSGSSSTFFWYPIMCLFIIVKGSTIRKRLPHPSSMHSSNRQKDERWEVIS